MENSNRAAVIMKLLDMKDRVMTKDHGLIEVDSYSGKERQALKAELYRLVNPDTQVIEKKEEPELEERKLEKSNG